jgi:carboxymethylenebutenolidase
MGQQINFQVGDTSATGYVALPASGTGPGILVLHAWWGLNAVFTAVCDQLAHEGFVAFAPDLYAGQIATTIEAAEALVGGPQIEGIAFAGLDYLAQHPAVIRQPLGVVGFSMGAAWSLVLSSAKPEHIGAVVLFYGTYLVDFSAARAAYLGHYAEHDSWEPVEEVKNMETALQSAGRSVTFHVYPAVAHWFAENNRPEYNPQATALAWQRTMAFFHEQLG